MIRETDDMGTYDFSRPTHYTASVFVVNRGRVLLLKQERSRFWIAPGGHVEDNELPHEAALREVLEETGLQIELLEKTDEKARTEIATPLPRPHHITVLPCGSKRDVDFVFTAKTAFEMLKINSESEDARWFSRDELEKDPSIGPYTRYCAIKILEENPLV